MFTFIIFFLFHLLFRELCAQQDTKFRANNNKRNENTDWIKIIINYLIQYKVSNKVNNYTVVNKTKDYEWILFQSNANIAW